MATYNFTVRATDNSGAYADRNFSMTVNNTQIDRFMAVGTAGLGRSQDGVNWNTELSISGTGIRYENGQWVVWNDANVNANPATTYPIRTSVDGVNWKTLTPVIKTYRTSYTGVNTWNGANMIKYRKGAWYTYLSIYTSTGPMFYLDEYTSTDLVNWNSTGSNITSYTSASSNYFDGVQDFDYDPTGDNWIAVQSNYTTNGIFRRNGTGGWTNITASFANWAFAGRYTGKVTFLNGLWIVTTGTTGVWTSVDSINWTYRDTSTLSTSGVIGPIYSNGRLLLMQLSSSTTSGGPLLQSVNAGHTWTTRTIASGISPYNWSTNTIHQQPIDTYAGTTIAVMPSKSGSTIFTTKDDGLNWTNATLTGIGNIYAVATRTT